MTYSFSDKEILKRFVESCNTPEFPVKRQKGKETREKNIYPHILSRGGYDKPKKTIIK